MNTNFLLRKPNGTKTLGIEIEALVDVVENPNWGYESYSNFFFLTRDGSIYRDHYPQVGVEFVSQPLTQDFLKRAIRKLYSKFKIEDNKSTGIHVHASRKWVTEDKAKAIHEFLNTLTEAEVRELFGRLSNGYSDFGTVYGSTRYAAVNVENKNTVEFRMFKSGSVNWAQYCVDMVVYLIENAYHLNKDALFAFKDLSFRKYNL